MWQSLDPANNQGKAVLGTIASKLRGAVATKEINAQRFSAPPSRKFEDVAAAFQEAVGHPDMNEFRRNITAAGTYAELEKVVHGAVGPSDLMEFTRFDLGLVRPDGDLPCSIREFRGFESGSRSGLESRSCINGCG